MMGFFLACLVPVREGVREEEGEGVGGRFESLNLYKHDLFFFCKQTMRRGFRGLLTFQVVILTCCLVLLSFTPAVDEVVGEDVDILAPAIDNFLRLLPYGVTENSKL